MLPSTTAFCLAPMASLGSSSVSQSVQRTFADKFPRTSLLPRSTLFAIKPGNPEDEAGAP